MIWFIVAVIVIVGSLIRLWYFIKRMRTKGCKNKKSRYGTYCFGSHGRITEEEKEELLKYLDQL